MVAKQKSKINESIHQITYVIGIFIFIALASGGLLATITALGSGLWLLGAILMLVSVPMTYLMISYLAKGSLKKVALLVILLIICAILWYLFALSLIVCCGPPNASFIMKGLCETNKSLALNVSPECCTIYNIC
jgi:hypothetical protein